MINTDYAYDKQIFSKHQGIKTEERFYNFNQCGNSSAHTSDIIIYVSNNV